jgi:hypothetical protein
MTTTISYIDNDWKGGSNVSFATLWTGLVCTEKSASETTIAAFGMQ